MKKMWKYAAVVLVCVLTLGACGNLDSSKTSGDAAQDRKIQIGMSFDSLFARHGRALTGVSPEHAQIVGSV